MRTVVTSGAQVSDGEEQLDAVFETHVTPVVERYPEFQQALRQLLDQALWRPRFLQILEPRLLCDVGLLHRLIAVVLRLEENIFYVRFLALRNVLNKLEVLEIQKSCRLYSAPRQKGEKELPTAEVLLQNLLRHLQVRQLEEVELVRLGDGQRNFVRLIDAV